MVTSFNNVPLSLLLQGRDFRTLPVTMLDYVQQSYDPMVAAASTLVLAATVVIAVIAERTVGFAKIFGGINQ
jgi:putative spermidine/putrescine transport system permease protein